MLRRTFLTISIGGLIFAAGAIAREAPETPDWYGKLQKLKPVCDLALAPIGPACQESPNAEKRANTMQVMFTEGPEEALAFWRRARSEVADQCRRSLLRQGQLLNSLADKHDPQFAQAATLLDAEHARFEALARKEHRLRLRGYDWGAGSCWEASISCSRCWRSGSWPALPERKLR